MKLIKLASILFLFSLSLNSSDNKFNNHRMSPLRNVGKYDIKKMDVGQRAGPWLAYFTHQTVICVGVMANAAGIPVPPPVIQAVAIGAAAAAEMLPTP